MFYVDYNAEEWSKKHGLDIEEMECCGCKKKIIVDVPIRIKGYAGFEMREHECSHNKLSAIFTPIDEKEISFWKGIT